jgi:hypothetical protein
MTAACRVNGSTHTVGRKGGQRRRSDGVEGRSSHSGRRYGRQWSREEPDTSRDGWHEKSRWEGHARCASSLDRGQCVS